MKKLASFVLFAAFLVPLTGQEAQIIVLRQSDTARLKKAYTEYQRSMAAWEELKAKTAIAYVAGQDGRPRKDWSEVEFSVDFRALVPQHWEPVATGLLDNSDRIVSTSTLWMSNAPK